MKRSQWPGTRQTANLLPTWQQALIDAHLMRARRGDRAAPDRACQRLRVQLANRPRYTRNTVELMRLFHQRAEVAR